MSPKKTNQLGLWGQDVNSDSSTEVPLSTARSTGTCAVPSTTEYRPPYVVGAVRGTPARARILPPSTGRKSVLQSLGCREVLGFEARLLESLPAQVSLVLAVGAEPVRLDVSERASRIEAARRLGVPVLNWAEWAALITGAESDRGQAAALITWIGYKRTSPAWRVRLAEVMGDVAPSARVEPCGWSVGRVLSAWGAELTQVFA